MTVDEPPNAKVSSIARNNEAALLFRRVMVYASSERSGCEAENSGWQPDFHWLTDNLAVGGWFPIERARELANVHRIGAVIDLRQEDRDDEALLQAAGIGFLHLPTPDLAPVSVAMLDQGVRFAREHIRHGRRVLIHCQHGIGRSALLSLCVLVDQGLEPLDALNLAKDQRGVVSPSRAQYDGWAAWLGTRGQRAPDYHTFGCIAYRHLAGG